MKILILGGTKFLGPHTVEAAIARGHELTLFNRGRTNPHLFPDLEKLVGDRNGDLEALADRTWDAVIDTHAHIPRWVRLSAGLLAGAVRQYLFVSTLSVYPLPWRGTIDESAALERLPEGEPEEPFSGRKYGALKVLCEEAAEAAFPGHATVVRPGLIVGPLDPSDRFTYWPVRVSRGGDVLAPGFPEAPVQFIDVRDLGAFLVQLVEDGHAGTYNAVGFEEKLTMEALLADCRKVSESDASFTWVDEAFLQAQGVGAWMEMPLWIPKGDVGFFRFANDKAREVGLAFRAPADTIRDTLAWAKTRPADHRWRAGLAAEKEARVLAAWHARDE
ncbi:MAG: NAD-dependent epimerase/dehydratase family protein [Planctomycetota bacterium]